MTATKRTVLCKATTVTTSDIRTLFILISGGAQLREQRLPETQPRLSEGSSR